MTKPKRVIVSWSSGKDSTLTLIKLLEDPCYQVIGLYTTYVGNEVPFQVTPIDVVAMQAKLTGLPLITIELPEVFPSNEIYQTSVVEGLEHSGLDIEAVAFGDMFCNGIVEYRKSYIEKAGWKCVFPLLGIDSQQLANEIIDRNIKTFLVTTDNERLHRSFCGQWYSKTLLEDLPSEVDSCGENGEFHTLVTSAPCFDGHLNVVFNNLDSGERFTHQRYTAKIGE
ncbi:ATPase [Vibrio tapetis]|uniref:Putative Adenine nucleotide alpha hydrolase n=1 Tax=Vibrio tapetis subsp. tapetis TaxID=1671868 RepID=A0A2N8ZHL9_9VIBR|nr:ATPase [Vibrio tapetis]SON51387.1 putative Adenine nucleotide alpha hydrolase [Vibrio tapetis subsp. tapetis]